MPRPPSPVSELNRIGDAGSASGAGFDQLQNLRTDAAGTALAIETPENLAGGSFDVACQRCGFRCPGVTLSLTLQLGALRLRSRRIGRLRPEAHRLGSWRLRTVTTDHCLTDRLHVLNAGG